ncbi:MFS transporter [Novosphingobium sp. 9]|uniref:MFS transporter n=1 Tax=Novosphingobium sp. 9 TaxID=2025349 RepID=UPI0021B680EA|nr:MFS transporter [Novosphingobium sp. 9]
MKKPRTTQAKLIRPKLPLARIVEMNLGFFGLQFSFGLQQANMAPIYAALGAHEATMPLLWIAGPVTGLIVQPLIGALSDRTRSRFGRRVPYFLIGAVLCSAGLFAMPLSPALWIAASLLWLLDAANNVTMEPYRAYVADRLSPEQRPAGFLTQSAFTGLAQTLAYLAPSLLTAVIDRNLLDANGIPAVVRVAFVLGAVISLATIVWSVLRVPELPPDDAERARLDTLPRSLAAPFRDLLDACVQMPRPMRQMMLPMLCQWYAIFAYWQYVAHALARGFYGSVPAHSPAFRAATLTAQQLGAAYNLVAILAALLLIPLVRRHGPRAMHVVCLCAGGGAMIALSQSGSLPVLALAALGIGLCWAGMMGNPYVMLASCIPPERNGVYMGLFNLFIVVPMLIETLTLPLLFHPVLTDDPRHVLLLAGLLMLAGALATRFVQGTQRAVETP